MNKTITVLLGTILVSSLLTACGGSDNNVSSSGETKNKDESSQTSTSIGSVATGINAVASNGNIKIGNGTNLGNNSNSLPTDINVISTPPTTAVDRSKDDAVVINGSGSHKGIDTSANSDSVDTEFLDAIITTNCSTPDNGKTYLVTEAGCVIKTPTSTQTGICTSSTTMKLLSGTNLSKKYLINNGSSFNSSNNLSINNISYKCI